MNRMFKSFSWKECPVPPIDQGEVDDPELTAAALALGIDLRHLPDILKVRPPPEAEASYQPLSDAEWACIERHIKDAIRIMRPPAAARTFIENLLIGEHAQLSERYLPDSQESTRQRGLRWALNGRLEQLAADLKAAGELDEDRMAAFDALAEKAKSKRERILAARADRLNKRTMS